jgi:hypothetical protein
MMAAVTAETGEYTMPATVISATCTKSDRGGWKPLVKVNGGYIYHTERNAKTERGAMSRARNLAARIANNMIQNGFVVVLSTSEREIP